MRLRISPDDDGMNAGIERSRSEVGLMNEQTSSVARLSTNRRLESSGLRDGGKDASCGGGGGGGFVGVTSGRSETDDLAEYIL